MTAASLPPAARPRPSLTRVIVAASLGNAMEWFDFLAVRLFRGDDRQSILSDGNETASLLLTLGTFSVSFLVRPIGAIVIGAYTDRKGRRAGLTLSIMLMVVGTTMTALIPGYATIGLAAPILILLARLMQGFSVGGEFGSAVTFLAEQTASRKGFVASWQWASTGITEFSGVGFRNPAGELPVASAADSIGAGVSRSCSGFWSDRRVSIYGAGSMKRRNLSKSSRPARRSAICYASTRWNSLLAIGISVDLEQLGVHHSLHPDLCGKGAAPAAEEPALSRP